MTFADTLLIICLGIAFLWFIAGLLEGFEHNRAVTQDELRDRIERQELEKD